MKERKKMPAKHDAVMHKWHKLNELRYQRSTETFVHSQYKKRREAMERDQNRKLTLKKDLLTWKQVVMASFTDPTKWLDGLEIKIASVADLLLVEDEEDTPYKSKYAAIDLLQELIDQGDVICGDEASKTACTAAGSDLAATEGPKHPSPSKVQLEVAKLRARRGIIMMDTDLRGDGEQCLLQALPVLEMAPAQITELQECWNTLGALHSSRGSFDVAIIWLHKAESLYEAERTHAQQGQSSVAPVHEEGSPPALSTPQPDAVKLEAQYTSTVFFLAQASA